MSSIVIRMLSLIAATMLASQAGAEQRLDRAFLRRWRRNGRVGSGLRYELVFVVPADSSSPVQGQVTIRSI